MEDSLKDWTSWADKGTSSSEDKGAGRGGATEKTGWFNRCKDLLVQVFSTSQPAPNFIMALAKELAVVQAASNS